MKNDAMSLHRHHFEKAFKEFCTATMEKYNLTNNEVIILIYLSENTKNTAKDIVNEFLFSKSHVSLSTEQLTSKGYIKKIPAGKATRLLVTPKGKEIVDKLKKQKEQFNNIIFKDFTIEEKETLDKLYHKILNNIKNYDPKGGIKGQKC